MQWPYKEWGASVVLAGHDHDYERLAVNGFPYLVVGTSGAPLKPFEPAHQVPDAEVDVRYGEGHGAVLAEATARALVLQFYTDAGALFDNLRLDLPTD